MSMTPNQQRGADDHPQQQQAPHSNIEAVELHNEANPAQPKPQVSSFQSQLAFQQGTTDTASHHALNANNRGHHNDTYANAALLPLPTANAGSYAAPLLFPLFATQLLSSHQAYTNTASSFSESALAQLMMLQTVGVGGGEATARSSAWSSSGVHPALMQAALGPATVSNSSAPSLSSTTTVASSTNSVLPPAAAVADTSVIPPKEVAASSSISRPYRRRILYCKEDDSYLSPYQCLLRKQIELFEATESDLQGSAQGRNRAIILKQVGIRCRHCGHLPTKKQRAKGAVFFPSQLMGLYQTGQNMGNGHLVRGCHEIPMATRDDLIRVRQNETGSKKGRSASGGGRQYWASCLRVLGVVETYDRRLQFSSGRDNNR
jgi:hypothetical protein